MKVYSFGKRRDPTRFCFLIFVGTKYRVGLHPYKDLARIYKSENEFVDQMINNMMEESEPSYIVRALFEWQD
jgi:hypothetical protein